MAAAERAEPAEVPVLMTGFEPFGDYAVNPSWELVKTFNGECFGRARITSHLLPVVYGKCLDDVSDLLPKILRSHQPQLTVLCGVGRPGQIKIETLARNGPYVRLDNHRTHPASERCRPAGCDQALTLVDVDRVLARVHSRCPDIKVSASEDAGLFLCEYSFYLAMHSQKAPAVFVHVPPDSDPYSLPDLRRGLHAVVEALVHTMLPQAALGAHAAWPSPPSAALSAPRPRVGLGVFVRSPDHPGCILLGQRIARHSTGNAHGLHTHALPGGHLEFGESFVDCARRELQEECGLALAPGAVSFGTLVNAVDRADSYHYVVIMMVAELAAGQEPTNCEPAKCAGWHWHAWDSELPEPLFTSLRLAREQGFNPFTVGAGASSVPS